MDLDSKKIFKTLNPNKIWIPVILGLAIVFYISYRDPNITLSTLRLLFDTRTIPVILAIFVLLCRDVGYIYRIRVITNKELTWTSSIFVVILWEFASAVTPSVVGGTAVAVFILLKEGINLGKSLAYVMVTAILDNMFFVVAAPIILLLTQGDIFPAIPGIEYKIGNSLQYIFFISYSLIAIYTFVMAFGLFVKPRAFKWVLIKITSIKFLRKWRHSAYEHGNEVVYASEQLKGGKASYWMKIILATIFIWSARYVMLNCLIAAYSDINFTEHMMIFSRQVIMWILMLASPTPGSSGTAEFFFTQFFRLFLGDYTFITMLFWRMLSYYPYLLLGAIFLPRWIKRVFFKNKKHTSIKMNDRMIE